MIIPLHSLVIAAESNHQLDKFQNHEFIDNEQVRDDLFGCMRPEMEHVVKSEVARRISLKLNLGERVVFCDDDASQEQVYALTSMAASQGASVFVLQDNEVFNPVVSTMPDKIQNDFDGITVVGDVHGEVVALEQAVSWAKNKNHFLWFLGDLIDYGEDSLNALNIVHELVMSGEAATMMGNHERKIAKWLQNRNSVTKTKIRLSEGNKITIQAFNRLSVYDQNTWTGKFSSVVAKASLIQTIRNVTMTHAAVHPDYWSGKDSYGVEKYALYGEHDASFTSAFKLSHNWIDHVPNNHIVMVGHENHGLQYPFSIICQSGGKVVFLDTGCGKGGPLSTADLRFNGDNLEIGNFNRHSGRIK